MSIFKPINLTLLTQVPSNFRTSLGCLFAILSSVFMISYQTPFFLLFLFPLSVVYYYVQKYYVPTSRQLRRLDSVSISPIYAQFSETLNGISTIRAFRAVFRSVSSFEEKLTRNIKCYFCSVLSNRWLAIRLEFCSNLVVLLAALLAVLGRDHLGPGQLGLSITYSLSITYALSWMVRTTSEFETNIVSVERILEYCKLTPEADWDDGAASSTVWPSEGVIKFENYSTKYPTGQALVLKNLSVTIESKSKVGIVGRTGAGKSTLSMSLFRIIEAVSGQILIDDVDIAKIGLHRLRGALAVIPQDPVLFAGTLRFNLDPFEVNTDEEIWQALERSHMKAYVSSLEGGLSYKITEGGGNMSLGQKQLLCMARALLKDPKVLGKLITGL